jgi:epoxyqueuosine reductase
VHPELSAEKLRRVKSRMKETKIIEEILIAHLKPEDQFIYGFANLTGLLDPKFKGFDYGISIGKKLNDRIVDKIVDGPTLEYYLHYKQINKDLEQLATYISNNLNANGIKSLKIEPTVSTGDLDTKYSETLRTDLSHKMVATRSGLGWIGKSDLFISKRAGPRLRLVSILIQTPVSPESKPVDKSRCGRCSLCLEICPAKACNGILWNISVKREVFFDPWKCREQCKEFGKSRLGTDARVCGMCVAVCPIGKSDKTA